MKHLSLLLYSVFIHQKLFCSKSESIYYMIYFNIHTHPREESFEPYRVQEQMSDFVLDMHLASQGLFQTMYSQARIFDRFVSQFY